MGLQIDIQEFASMAEARAHYIKQGYVTLNNTVDGRRYVMVKDEPGQALSPMVELTKIGFLQVQAQEL